MTQPIRSLFRASATLGAVALLGACALLSSPDPVQLYRFGGNPADPGPALAAPVNVQLRPVTFPEASRTDKLLGVTGVETAYIAGARWVAPAQDLYSPTLEAAFAAQSARVRLIGRRELTPVTRLLDINVTAFETRYAAVDTIPTVVISARARLLRSPDRTVVAERTFSISQPAADNRVAAIVEAYDIATRDLNTQIVGWTDGSVGG